MATWNQNVVQAKRKQTVGSAAAGVAWSGILATGLATEASVHGVGTFVGNAVLASLFPGTSLHAISQLKTAYSVLIGCWTVLMVLWLFQHMADLVQCARPGKPTVSLAPSSAAPSAPATPAPRAAATMDSMGSGDVTPRHVSSPYQRLASPYSTLAPATTPQELARMQTDFAEGLSGAPRGASVTGFPGTPGSLPATPGSASDWDVGRATAYYSPPAPYQFQQLAGDPSLPADLPKYHYSLQSSGGGAAASSSAALHPSAPRQVADVMRRLSMSSTELRVWAERLRYWTSERVMQPLLKQMTSSSKRVTDAVNRCQASSNIILAVRPLMPPSGLWSDLELCTDDEFSQATMTLQMLSSQQTQQAGLNAVNAALKAVRDYRMLSTLLRGDYPNKGILGNCPPGYLASRVAAFASDSCCGAFKWQGGGAWGGRTWTRDLPTDTHILIYIVGAFCSAPFWKFEDTQGMILGSGGPLCVGAVPARRPDAFTAILATKPKKEDMAQMKAALLLLAGAAGEPLILLVLDGKPTVTLCGEWACFEKVTLHRSSETAHGVAMPQLYKQIVLFLVYVQRELDSKIGPFSLDYLLLKSVLEDVPIDTSIRQKRWFGILT